MSSKKRITLAILAATALVGAGLVASAVNAARPAVGSGGPR